MVRVVFVRLTEFYTEKSRFYYMHIIPEFVLRVRNNFPGNVSFGCTLKGKLGMKEGKRIGQSMWSTGHRGSWVSRADEARGGRRACRLGDVGAVGTLRAVGVLHAWCWQGDGFGVENGWEVCVSKPLGSSEDVKEEMTGRPREVVSDRNGEIRIMDIRIMITVFDHRRNM